MVYVFIDDKQKDLDKINNEKMELEHDKKRLNDKINSHKQNMSKNKDEIRDLNDLLLQNKKNNQDMKDQFDKLIDENEQLRNDNAFLAEQHVNLRGEHEQLYSNYSSLQKKATEISNMYSQWKQEENILRNELRNSDILSQKKDNEIKDLQQWIYALESKNKELGDSIRTHFYTQANNYEEKVMNLLQRSDDPRRARKLIDHGIEPSSIRMNNIIRHDHVSYASRIPDYSSRKIPASSEGIRSYYRGRSTSPVPSKPDVPTEAAQIITDKNISTKDKEEVKKHYDELIPKSELEPMQENINEKE